jgi:uncharacterized repeat protein (TIGR03803 family)
MSYFVDQQSGAGYGGNFPKGRLFPVGTNYWFLTEQGGTFGVGAIMSFDPATSNLVQIAGLDNNTGKTPYGSFVIANGKAWFTTERGGGGDRGTLSYIDTNTLALPTAVFNFPTNNTLGHPNCGERPRGTPVVIGNELWMMTSQAGSNSGGSMVKYDMNTGITTPVHQFAQATGSFPFGSLVLHSNAYYFTTHQGGANSSTAFPNGAGTLSRLTFDGLGNPTITKLVDMPVGNTGFPDGDICPVGSNHLYFMTTGNTANPGSLVRYDITNNSLNVMFTFTTATRTNFGASPNGATPIHVDGNLYFSTQNGGVVNRGIIAKYDIANNTMTKLADLVGVGATSLGGSSIYSSATYVNDPNNCKKIIYMLSSRGGANGSLGQGTLVSINLFQPVATIVSGVGSSQIMTWGGGYPPFLVQSTTNIASPVWVSEATGLMTNRFTISATNAAKYFRVSSPCP